MTVPRRAAEAEEARRNGLARKLARRKRAGALLAPLQTLAASPPYRRALALQDFVESASGLIGKVHPAVAVAPVEVDAGDRLSRGSMPGPSAVKALSALPIASAGLCAGAICATATHAFIRYTEPLYHRSERE
jgi:hypothetical protein